MATLKRSRLKKSRGRVEIEYNLKVLKYPNNNEVEYIFYARNMRTDYKIEKETKEEKVVNEEAWIEQIDRDIRLDRVEAGYCEPKERYEKYLKHERSVKSSMSRAKKNIYELARANSWEWFVTLTFDPKKVNRYDFDDCVKKQKNFIDYIRRANPNMKYISCPDLHQDNAFHFHLLMSGIENVKMIDSGIQKKGHVVYNLGSYNFGFSTATKIKDSARSTNYITKYITKVISELLQNKKRYFASKNLERPIEEKIYIDPETKKIMREELKKKSYYESEVEIDVDGYKNEIEYINIKLSDLYNGGEEN